LRSSPRKPSHLRDARSLLGFALFAPFATFLLDQARCRCCSAGRAILALAALLRLAELESGDARHPTVGLAAFHRRVETAP
jgi:hypothetical protein